MLCALKHWTLNATCYITHNIKWFSCRQWQWEASASVCGFKEKSVWSLISALNMLSILWSFEDVGWGWREETESLARMEWWWMVHIVHGFNIAASNPPGWALLISRLAHINQCLHACRLTCTCTRTHGHTDRPADHTCTQHGHTHSFARERAHTHSLTRARSYTHRHPHTHTHTEKALSVILRKRCRNIRHKHRQDERTCRHANTHTQIEVRAKCF